MKNRVFNLSFQKCGTTSFERFCKEELGLAVLGWNIEFDNLYYLEDFDKIFNHRKFLSNQVFSDSPWWSPNFYLMLYKKFPDSKFILIERNLDDWFDSYKKFMERLPRKYPSYVKIQAKLYNRNDHIPGELSLPVTEIHRGYYKHFVENHNSTLKKFFQQNSPDNFFNCDLYDPDKWNKLANFLGFNKTIKRNYHENKTELKI
jgi:hypothetical protein